MNFIVLLTYSTVSVTCLLLGLMEEASLVYTFIGFTMLLFESEKFEGEQQKYVKKRDSKQLKKGQLKKRTMWYSSLKIKKKVKGGGVQAHQTRNFYFYLV